MPDDIAGALEAVRQAGDIEFVGSGRPGATNPTIGIAGCCARAASGHAVATPPRSVKNSRRLMSFVPVPRSTP